MAVTCCQLVGNFPIEELGLEGCIISMSHNSQTEVSKAGSEVIVGATTGTVTLTAYAAEGVYIGCPGKANVSIQWIRKYDCTNDSLYFIWQGAGNSSVYGGDGGQPGYLRFDSAQGSPVNNFAVVLEGLDKIDPYRIINADSSNGPGALYTDTTQQDGYGLEYNGDPFNFNTNTEDGCTFPNYGIGVGDWLLQSFNVDLNPGSMPTATYTFVFNVENTADPC